MRRRVNETLSNFLDWSYGLFGITWETKWIKQVPLAFFENLLFWIGLGHYLGGKRKKISHLELLFLCTGVLADDVLTGVALGMGGDEGNLIYAGTIDFFQNLFGISQIASTRWILLGEVLILYFYITIFGLNFATRITLHSLNILRLVLGYERWNEVYTGIPSLDGIFYGAIE